MPIKRQSARERTGLYVLAVVLAGLGSGTAVAAPHKKATTASTTAHIKAAAVQGASKKLSKASRKSASSQKKSASATAAISPRRKPAGKIQLASAVAAQAQAASKFRTDSLASSISSLPERIVGGGLNGRNLPYGEEDEFRKSPKTDYVPTDLVRLAPKLAMASGKAIFLRQEAAESMETMIRDAAKEGLKLRVVSAYRDVAHQTRLYEAAIRAHGKNQKMVGRPGRSEHFLGTTVDVTNDNAGHLLKPAFAQSAEYRWLEKNAAQYGWKFTVRAGMHGRKASQDEPWHIRYMGSPKFRDTSSDSPILLADTLQRLRELLAQKNPSAWNLSMIAQAMKLARLTGD